MEGEGSGGRRAGGKYRKRSSDRFPIGASCRLVAGENLFDESVLRGEGEGGTQKVRKTRDRRASVDVATSFHRLSLSLSEEERKGSVFKHG